MANTHVWFRFTVFMVLIGFSRLVIADETTINLAYRFKTGDFYHYDVDDQAVMTTQYGENQSVLRQHTQILKSYRIVAVDENGGATIEPIMETVKMASQTADKPPTVYDSTKPEETPKEFEKVASAVGRPQARFHVSSNGRLSKVTLLDKELPRNFGDLAAKADPSINPLVILPDHPVKIGDKWTEKFDSSVVVGTTLNRPITLIRSFELLKVADGLATIRSRTSLFTPMNDPEILRQLVHQMPDGTIEFDLQGGRIFNRSFKINEKVIGAFGDQSYLEAIGPMTERLVDPNLPRVAGNPSKPPVK